MKNIQPESIITTVVVTGTPVQVRIDDHEPLRSIIAPALKLAGDAHMVASQWQLRDEAGNEIDKDKTPSQLGLDRSALIFLNLPAGIAASNRAESKMTDAEILQMLAQATGNEESGARYIEVYPDDAIAFARALLAQATQPSRDWPEDFPHENGNYTCTCSRCGNQFIGHKRRVVCKVCAQSTQPEVVQAKPVAWMREAVARAIWNIRREDEDRCDMELEDIREDHSVWREADAVLSAIPPAQQVEKTSPKAYCKACQEVGMSNCANFDECGEPRCVTCHRPLNTLQVEKQPTYYALINGDGRVEETFDTDDEARRIQAILKKMYGETTLTPLFTTAPASQQVEKDAELFVWWFSDTDKGNFLSAYMQGCSERWGLDKWRAAINSAIAQKEKDQ